MRGKVHSVGELLSLWYFLAAFMHGYRLNIIELPPFSWFEWVKRGVCRAYAFELKIQ